MLMSSTINFVRNKNSCLRYNVLLLKKCYYCKSTGVEAKYNDEQKQKILEVMNTSNMDQLSVYDITKGRLQKFSQWKISNGKVNSISDVEYIDGFTERTAKKLFDSILEEVNENSPRTKAKIKGQILHPVLSEKIRNDCKTVLAIYITVNSVSWTLIERVSYEVREWRYYNIDVPETKKMQITDILDIAWDVTNKLPTADIYVMKAEPTTLRAAGSDPNNPKVLAVNLQKAQMTAMIVALINARSYGDSNRVDGQEESGKLSQSVYFLRPSLPYRLYGTLVGNERVSTDQTVEMLLNDTTNKSESQMSMSETLKDMFRVQTDLRKDMLGHCLLLALTFMDLCIYKNQESINKLVKKQQ